MHRAASETVLVADRGAVAVCPLAGNRELGVTVVAEHSSDEARQTVPEGAELLALLGRVRS